MHEGNLSTMLICRIGLHDCQFNSVRAPCATHGGRALTANITGLSALRSPWHGTLVDGLLRSFVDSNAPTDHNSCAHNNENYDENLAHVRGASPACVYQCGRATRVAVDLKSCGERPAAAGFELHREILIDGRRQQERKSGRGNQLKIRAALFPSDAEDVEILRSRVEDGERGGGGGAGVHFAEA